MLKHLTISVFIFLTGACFLIFSQVAVEAYVAASTNYRLESDSLNFAGGLATSTNYSLEDTLGEMGTGTSTSASYNLSTGYQQMAESSLSISAPSDVSLTPALTSGTAGTATGNAVWTVITDNSAGYTMSVAAATNPAFAAGSNSFANYTPSGAAPDYAWSVAAGAAEFGISVEGTDTSTRFLDNGAACNTGATNGSDTCWDALGTSATTIATAGSANQPGGTATTLKFQAEIGSGATPGAGTYSATVTVTAVAL